MARASVAMLVAREAEAAPAGQPPAESVIGFSQGGQPLTVHHLGEGSTRVFVLGGQHGGPEANTIRLVRQLMAHFAGAPEEVPSGIGLDFMPVGNPDGVSVGSRQFLSGVDPNRNWGGPDWQPDAYDSNGVFRPGLGGPEPFSEQETRALRDWLLARPPLLVANYHSAGGFMFGGGSGLGEEIAAAYAGASGYPRPTAGGGGGGGGRSPLPYRATGSMNPWLRTVGINSVFVELSTPSAVEFERNLAGLRAALGVLARA